MYLCGFLHKWIRGRRRGNAKCNRCLMAPPPAVAAQGSCMPPVTRPVCGSLPVVIVGTVPTYLRYVLIGRRCMQMQHRLHSKSCRWVGFGGGGCDGAGGSKEKGDCDGVGGHQKTSHVPSTDYFHGTNLGDDDTYSVHTV